MVDERTNDAKAPSDPEPGPAPVPGFNPWTIALREEFQTEPPRLLATLMRESLTFELRHGKHSLWTCVKWPDGGSMALRAGHCPDGKTVVREPEKDGAATVLRLMGAVGEYRVRIEMLDPRRALLRITTSVVPEIPLTMPFWPSDIYPMDGNCDPVPTEGVIHAAQRGTAGGIIFLTVTKPRTGSLLYVQDFTRLNPFFQKTGTKPDTRVGGRWPELGYTPPPFVDTCIPAGDEVIFSDAILRFAPRVPDGERDAARMFLEMLAEVYPHLTRGEPGYHHWPVRAEQTLDALENSPFTTVQELGHLYLHPYVDAEYPDSMVQLSVLLALREYGRWLGKELPLARKLRAGIPEFYDKKIGAVRRYLKTVGDDKNADEVDSWYLYHPLVNLARLAGEGDEEARDILLGSMDFAIKVARHFKYVWPVQFDIVSLEVIKRSRKEGEPGQSDVPGLYAYLMLQVWTLTNEKRYLEEAKKAICSLDGLDFSIGYQFNNAAWGAVACIRLFRETGDRYFQDQSELFLASFFHNTYLWESEIGHSKHFPTFMGVSCLHDGDYMAAYEEFEAFSAWHEYLDIAGDDAPEYVRLLLSEYCRHLLDRGWYYYPDALPEEALATETRNGHIERDLAIPLEDLYADGSPNGSVGQEIYGCGAAYAFVVRSYRHITGAEFGVYCDLPVRAWDESQDRCVTFQIMGVSQVAARLRLVGKDGSVPSSVRISTDIGAAAVESQTTPEGHLEYYVPGSARVAIDWSDA